MRGKVAGRTAKQHRGLPDGTVSDASVSVDERTAGLQGRSDRDVSATHHLPLTFWVGEGGCFEGETPHIGREVVFIESKRIVPIGTDVTIRLTLGNEASSVLSGVAEGTVVWQCTSGDQFNNRKGFGVCLQRRWPEPPEATKAEGSKEAA